MGWFVTLREDGDFVVTVLNCAVVTHAEAEGRENRDERIYGLLARGILGPKIKILESGHHQRLSSPAAQAMQLYFGDSLLVSSNPPRDRNPNRGSSGFNLARFNQCSLGFVPT